MKLLLDTQIMLWWLLGDSRLRQETRDRMSRLLALSMPERVSRRERAL